MTGVQTCALPIFSWALNRELEVNADLRRSLRRDSDGNDIRQLMAMLADAFDSDDVRSQFWKEYDASIRPIGRFNIRQDAEPDDR